MPDGINGVSEEVTSSSKHAKPDFWDLGSIKRAIEILEEHTQEPLEFEYDLEMGPNDKELRNYPNAFTVVHKVLQDCVTIQSCKYLDSGILANLIMNCQKESRDAWIGDYDFAVWSYGDSPTAFYLKWAKKFDQCELLRYWLTETARAGQLVEVTSLGDIPENQLVAAEFGVDKYWYRADILKQISSEVVRVLFVDYGNIEYCYVHQLRRLPQELMEPEYFAFKAKLCSVSVSDDNLEGAEVLKFLNKLKFNRRILCQITGIAGGLGGFEVAVFDQTGSVLHFFPPSSYSTPLDQDPDSIIFPLSTTHPLPDECPLLVHKSEELILPPRPWTDSNDYDHYSVITAVDPSEIYVKNISVLDVPDDGMKCMQDRLNEFYAESSEWVNAYRIRTSRLFQGRLYAWYNTTNSSWERVRVVRVDMPVGKVYVQRLDYGNKLLVRVEDMMELSPRFCKSHPEVESAHLVHVKPKNGRKVWSKKTCDDLKHIFRLDTEFLGVVFSREAYSYANNSIRWKSLGLLLTAASPRLPYSVQGLMVALGLAEATGIGAGNPNLIFAERESPNYRSDCDYNQKHSSTPCLKHVWDTVKYPYNLRGDEEELVKMGKLPSSLKEDQSKFLPHHIRRCLGWINFTQVYGPGHFYLQMENKKSELFEMMADLEKNIDEENMASEEIVPSKFVAVLYVHEENCIAKRTWNRGFVLKTNPKLNQAMVILVDFGIETIVNYRNIRPLPCRFTEHVPYCQRAHLDIPNSMPTGSKKMCKPWSSTAKHNFSEYIRKWSVECPVYLAFRSGGNYGIVHLSKFDEELWFSSSSGNWVAKKETMYGQRTDYACLNNFRDHKLLRHLFSSVGLQVYYEVFRGIEKFYYYEPVWGILLENGLLIGTPIL